MCSVGFLFDDLNGHKGGRPMEILVRRILFVLPEWLKGRTGKFGV